MMEIYRKGQGVLARMCIVALCGASGVMMTRSLYYFVLEWKRTEIAALIAVAVSMLLFGVASFLLYNHKKLTDFLIETEAEMKKVSWPTRKEIIASTIVVMITVLILGIFIGVSDLLLGAAMQSLDKLR